MNNESGRNKLVVVLGAGPAGLYAAKQLGEHGVEVVLLNRDVKPGGLAEYGIYYDKYKMKAGLRKQFSKILKSDKINYFGNVTIGEGKDLTFPEIKSMGFQAIMVAVGAQGTKWLGLPGEDLKGVYHAKDIVYHYNKLPPFSQQEFLIGKRVALIGVGNVMVDIAHWLIRDLKVDEVIAVARRGPAEIKFTKHEFQYIANNLDLQSLDEEIDRVRERMLAVNQDPEKAKTFIRSALPKALDAVSETRFRFAFLSSPKQILGDEQGRVTGLEVENTKLVPKNGDTKAKRLGTTRVLDVDTVVFCIGDKVDSSFGLPVEWNEFVKNPNPRYPINGVSYEAYDPGAKKPIDGVFMAGWSREASSGLVGVARKDGESGALAVLNYLETLPPIDGLEDKLEAIIQRIKALPHPVVDKEAIWRLEELERAIAEKQGVEFFKFGSNEEMLKAIGMI
ncbi:MAG TPA: FAD-dependent oxidoreductase [Anaerolineae bacterium]|nr:FAD-dependent oxidoreductase [Anaerolineae bacterium]